MFYYYPVTRKTYYVVNNSIRRVYKGFKTFRKGQWVMYPKIVNSLHDNPNKR